MFILTCNGCKVTQHHSSKSGFVGWKKRETLFFCARCHFDPSQVYTDLNSDLNGSPFNFKAATPDSVKQRLDEQPPEFWENLAESLEEDSNPYGLDFGGF